MEIEHSKRETGKQTEKFTVKKSDTDESSEKESNMKTHINMEKTKLKDIEVKIPKYVVETKITFQKTGNNRNKDSKKNSKLSTVNIL